MSEFIFNDTSQEALVVIPILEDELLEINENFRVEIVVIGNDSTNCLLVQPSAVDVVIIDNDSKNLSYLFLYLLDTYF